MEKYVVSICAAILIFEVLNSLIPEGEIKKYCICAARIIVFFIIISPLISAFCENFTPNEDIFLSDESYIQSENEDIYKNYMEELYERNGYFGQ